MTDNTNFNEFEPTFENKKKRPVWIWVVVGVGLLLVCCVVGVIAFGGALFIGVNESEEAMQTVDRFMESMEDEEFGDAYELFSPEAREQFPFEDIFNLGTGPTAVLFEGYQRVEMSGFDINSDAGTGTIATVNGKVFYAGGHEGTFEAEIAKEGGIWMLFNIDIEINP